jgi:uncharacterized protein
MTIPQRDAPVFSVKVGPIQASGASSTPPPTPPMPAGGATSKVPAAAGPLTYVFTAQPIDVTERVISFDFEDDDQKADQLELSLNNFDLALFDDPNWKHGNGLLVQWGYAGNLALPRTCVIQKITGSLTMKVTALATSIAMNKIKQSVTYENMKRSDIVAQIATANGFATSAQFIDDSDVMISATHQARMTDAEFLQHLAKREGFVFYIGPDGLHWEQRKIGTAPLRQLVYYTDPGQGDIISWNLENDITALPGLVTAAGRDPINKSDIKEDGGNSETMRDVAAPIAVAVVQRTGETVMADPATPTAASAVILTNAPNSTAAKREADGKYTKAQQVAAKITMDIIGDPSISAKQMIDVQGISLRLSGLYYIKKAKHKLSASSYTMNLEMVADGLHGGPGTSGVKTDGSMNNKSPADPEALNANPTVNSVNQRTGEVSYTQNTGQGQ